jgi:hypothetical protein
MGLSGMLKPNMAPVTLLVAGYWILEQRWRQFAIGSSGIGIGMVVAYLVGVVFVGRASAWLDWWGQFKDVVALSPVETGSGNFSVFYYLFGDQSEHLQVAMALGFVFLILACVWWGRRGARALGEENPGSRRRNGRVWNPRRSRLHDPVDLFGPCLAPLPRARHSDAHRGIQALE